MSTSLITSIIVALLGGGGLVALLGLFVVPASKKWEATALRVDKLEKKVERLERSNKNLTMAVAVLIQHGDTLRVRILQLDHGASI